MEHFEIKLVPIDPGLDLPRPGDYVHVLSKYGVLRYAFWHEGFGAFFFLGGRYEKSEVVCWYQIPNTVSVPSS